MRRQHDTRRGPFYVAAVVVTVATIAIFSLPESLVELMQRKGVLEGDSADWAYRLLALAALAQAAYGGFVVLRPERVGSDPELASEDRAHVSVTVARNAAGMTCLTLVYGIAAFALTGLRGGFWLFVTVAVAQVAWYYRAVGVIDGWLERRVAPADDAIPDQSYCPPLARALINSRSNAP